MTDRFLTLAFDTSAAHCAAALLLGDQLLEDETVEMAKGQAEAIMPMLEALLTRHGFHWADVTTLGVGIGPGNFTGIRISVAAARGLALSLGVKAVGVSRFEAQAWGHPRPITSLIEARKNHVYLQQLQDGGTTPPEFLTRDEATLRIGDGPAIGAGLGNPTPVATGVARYAALRTSITTTRPAPMYIRAADAAPPRDPAPVILDQV